MGEVSIIDILKKLNKDRSEEDKFRIASEQPDGFFIREVVPTGSVYLDFRIHSTLGKGGFVKGSLNLLIGGEGSGKSSLALKAAANEQKQTGKYVVYWDAEGTINESYIERMGVDLDRFIYYKGRNLEEMLDVLQEFSIAKDVGMIIIDSIPVFVSTVIENKSAEDNNMSVEARKFNSRMPIIEGNCSRRNIALVALTYYKLNPGAMGDPRVLSRGEWQRYMSNLTIELTKKDLIKDDDKNTIGHVIDVRLKKSKLQAYDSKESFQVNFYYQYGFNNFEEYVSIFIEKDIIRQGGAWFTFANEDGVEIKLNGKSKVLEFLKENEGTFKYLKNFLNNKVDEIVE